jgi:L-alanine-DL-glutamate epimerase-like enolase superfamily enzyme
MPGYGSGGFISYDERQLEEQLRDWKEQGIRMMKIKISNDLKVERSRVSLARTVVGADTELCVEANGACTPKQALALAQAFRDLNVSWFEEPVSSDDLSGMRFVREHAPAEMEIAAGEYGYTLHYFQRMLQQNTVDVLQADATRCLGISGFLQVGALADAWKISLSSHCGPTAHLHPMLSLPAARHIEYFHTHVRVEKMLFDGFLQPDQGSLIPDLRRPGMGIIFKHADAQRFAV